MKTGTTRSTRGTSLLKAFLCLLCFLWFLPPSAQAQNTYTLDQVFTKMDDVSKTFRSAETDIERTKVTVIVNDKDVSSGKFYYTRQGKEPRVKLELNNPTPQYLLINKGKLQIYTPKLKQVQEASLGGHEELVEMFMAIGFGPSSQDLKKNYDVTLGGEEVVDGKRTIVLDLKPKNTKQLKSVRMWLDQQKWVSVQVKANEASGDYMLFKYSNIKLNGNISDSKFDLNMPKNVQVVKL